MVNTFAVSPAYLLCGIWVLVTLHSWQLYVGCVALGVAYPVLLLFDVSSKERNRFSNALPLDPIQDMKNRENSYGRLLYFRFSILSTTFLAGFTDGYENLTWALYVLLGVLSGIANTAFAAKFLEDWRSDRDMERRIKRSMADLDNTEEKQKDVLDCEKEIESMDRAIRSYLLQIADPGLPPEQRDALELNLQITEDLRKVQQDFLRFLKARLVPLS